MSFVSFSGLIALAMVSGTLLNRSGKSKSSFRKAILTLMKLGTFSVSLIISIHLLSVPEGLEEGLA